jgi:hypothetical protein
MYLSLNIFQNHQRKGGRFVVIVIGVNAFPKYQCEGGSR